MRQFSHNIIKKLLPFTVLPFSVSAQVLITENFDDSNFVSRGWVDSTAVVVTTSEHISGSTSSAQYTFNQGQQKPTSGDAIRKTFTPTDSVYLSYYVKYSSNWQGSNQTYHPHEFYFLTTLNDTYSGLSDTYLTAYVEQNEGNPMVSLQDSQNIDESNINTDLTNTTENRSVAGCNGLKGAANNTYSDCYGSTGNHRNETVWRASNTNITDNNWHHVEAYLKINSISNGIGIADGIIQYWLDGQLLISQNTVLFRTGQHPTMQFDTLAIGPYIGDGSPVTQTFWVDNLLLGTSRQDNVRPRPPTNLTVQ